MAFHGKTRMVVLGGLGLGIVLLGLAALWLRSLNGDWLKARLIEKARQAGADLQIDSCTLSVPACRASLSGVRLLVAKKSATTVTVQLEHGEIEVRFWPLLRRRVEIDRLALERPHITAQLLRDEMTTTEKVQARNKRLGMLSEAAIEAVALDELFVGKREDRDISRRSGSQSKAMAGAALLARDLFMTDLTMNYRAQMGRQEPFTATVRVPRYHARLIDLGDPYELANRADYEADVDMGVPVHIDRKALAETSTWKISGVDLKRLDAMLDQTDALVYEGGILNLETSPAETKGSTMKMTLNGLKLGYQADSDRQTFLKVPVQRLVDYVQRQGNTIQLEMDTAGDLQLSSDMDFLSHEILKGLWKQSRGSEPDTTSTKGLIGLAAKRYLDSRTSAGLPRRGRP